MWFPWETDREAAITYQFLKNNIINSNYFTCTPNIFWLMKWPKIFSEKEKYWVEVKKEDLENPFKLNYDFTYKGKSRNLKLLKNFEENLHKIQFLPWLTNNHNISWRNFWDYIDRSYVFYLLKRYHKTNPFYKYKNVNTEILKLEFNKLLIVKFTISKYYQILKYDENYYVYDWVSCEEIEIDKNFKRFIKNYNNELSLNENIIINKLIFNNYEKLIYSLIKANILLYKKWI